MLGPYGVGLTSIEIGADDYCRQTAPDEAGAVISRAIAVPMLRKSFGLSVRRIQGHLQMGLPLEFSPVQDAAEAVARREEEFIYYGSPDFGLEGLLTAKGNHRLSIGDWSAVEQALNGYRKAEEKRTTRDPDAIAEALIDTERRRSQAERESRAKRSRNPADTDVGDLLLAGVALVLNVLS